MDHSKTMVAKDITKEGKSAPSDTVQGQRIQLLEKEVSFAPQAVFSCLSPLMLMQCPSMLLARAAGLIIFSLESLFLFYT